MSSSDKPRLTTCPKCGGECEKTGVWKGYPGNHWMDYEYKSTAAESAEREAWEKMLACVNENLSLNESRIDGPYKQGIKGMLLVLEDFIYESCPLLKEKE